ncbi:hypothetical protein HOLleu_39747 [Holothuria leucospilota]|uniref:Uncharacterized protein n=1 Tax=Holothuria leucospilota TaxID=206669 RepID=A0A9Q0YHC6_HOLLE|nr:hypothetical protein HOLleu_39747 [Holothuria leucospilota]
MRVTCVGTQRIEVSEHTTQGCKCWNNGQVQANWIPPSEVKKCFQLFKNCSEQWRRERMEKNLGWLTIIPILAITQSPTPLHEIIDPCNPMENIVAMPTACKLEKLVALGRGTHGVGGNCVPSGPVAEIYSPSFLGCNGPTPLESFTHSNAIILISPKEVGQSFSRQGHSQRANGESNVPLHNHVYV